MPNAALPEDEFIRLFEQLGPTALARHIGQAVRSVANRRRSLEKQLGIEITAPPRFISEPKPSAAIRKEITVDEGVIIVGSDPHYWPNEVSTAHLAFVHLCKKLKPAHVVLNGDVFDGARLARFDHEWEHTPTVEEELATCVERLAEIRKASKSAQHWWPQGNHDARFDRRLAMSAGEMEDIVGMSLKDHFPDWNHITSLWVNDSCVIKHNWAGGIHAGFNNVLKSGKTMVTGHTHRQLVRPYTDFGGLRYGIECGTLAEPFGGHADYADDNPRDWTSGFVVLTFKKGRLFDPELVRVVERGVYQFRGEWVNVSDTR